MRVWAMFRRMRIAWYRFLDTLGSAWRRARKALRERRKWGARWRDMTRQGRRYTRVDLGAEFKNPVTNSYDGHGYKWYFVRPEPGWEWTCPNCHTYSIVRKSDMPDILKCWEAMAKSAMERGYKAPPKPTAAMAGCTNCKYRPGAPE